MLSTFLSPASLVPRLERGSPTLGTALASMETPDQVGGQKLYD